VFAPVFFFDVEALVMSKGNVVCALCAVLGLVVSAGLANAGQPSASKMRQMGLYGAPVASDSEAMAVRGMGFAAVWGKSKVEYNRYGIEAKAENSYVAAGSHRASGKSFSFAGKVEIETGYFGNLKIDAKIGVAGGFASAHAH
jgi:hypothetical protein